jgi:hypothetical protein
LIILGNIVEEYYYFQIMLLENIVAIRGYYYFLGILPEGIVTIRE